MPDASGFTIADPPEDHGAEIARLAALDPIAYDRERQAAAERLGCRVSTLDDIVAQARPAPEAARGRGVALPAHEPWPEPVPLADVLDSLAAAVLRHVVVSPAAADALALWIAHTWVYERFEHTPRLSVTSPAKRCGKSTLLDVLHATCRRPLRADNISAAGTFRTVEALSPLSLLIDEADSFLNENEELRGILNSGFARGGEVIRVVEIDGEHQPVRFGTFAPVALAGIGTLPGTLEDRAVPIVLQRKATAETVVKLRTPGARAALHDLGRRLARWAADRGTAIGINPEVPAALGDREGDVSVPMLAVAEDAGGTWPARAAAALLDLFGIRAADEGGAEAGALLLADLRTLFTDKGATRMPSEEICLALKELEDRPWPEWRQGKPMTAVQLARVLKPFGVKPIHWRSAAAGKTERGYQRDHFADAWARYLAPAGNPEHPSSPQSPLPTRHTRHTPIFAGVSGHSDPAQESHVCRVGIDKSGSNLNGVPGVPGRKPLVGGKGHPNGSEHGEPGTWEATL